MAARFDLVTVDSPQPDRLAAFWCAVLGLHEVEREDGNRWIALADDGGVRRIGVQRGESRPGGTHLDLACAPADFDAELARIIALGASPLGAPRHEHYGSICNLVDPDGNVFDLCAYVSSAH